MNVKEAFETMEYGPAPEDSKEAFAWLKSHKNKFGQFINGAFTKPARGFDTKNPATSETLAKISQANAGDVEAAVKAARRAQPKWAALSGHDRAKHLYALARALQKHSRLFAVLETLDNGKPIREARDIDIPLAQRHFYYHAGMAQLSDTEMVDREPLGVCGQIIPWNFPLLMLSWKIAPALAMGNTVVLKPAEYTSLTALAFAELCERVGLPKGVVNIVTGDGRVGEMITNAKVDKIAFTGSTDVGRIIRKATAGSGKALTLELGGKSPYIVFDDADIDSAIEGLVDAIWFNQGQVCCAGSRLLVQEGIADAFYHKLKARMGSLRVGDPLDKCIDIGAVVDPVQLTTIKGFVDDNTEGETFQPDIPLPEGCFYPPTLITGLGPAAKLMQEEIFGPVLVSTTFRTPAEAIQLANNTRYGLAASVWTENINLALEIAPKLTAGVVWVNATNLFDAAAGFGGVRESGFGREGGWEGLDAYTKPLAAPKKPTLIKAFKGKGAFSDTVDRTAKLYIGGRQARPDGGYSNVVYGPKGAPVGEVGLANRKDIRNAVEAAAGAAGWSKTTGHLRAQILYYVAENLAARASEFADRLEAMTGQAGASEVNDAINTLFTYAAWADKFDGQAHGVPIRGVALAMKEPVGIIGALCAADRPLAGLVDVLAPTLAMGNRVVAVASDPFPLAATDFYTVLETSDVPGGVANILTGAQAELAPHLARHMSVEAIWNFANPSLNKEIEAESAGNLKRVLTAMPQDHRTMLSAATEVKNIWVPYGE